VTQLATNRQDTAEVMQTTQTYNEAHPAPTDSQDDRHKLAFLEYIELHCPLAHKRTRLQSKPKHLHDTTRD